MAEDLANHLNCYLQINVKHKEFLAQIRHWDNLKLAVQEDSMWVKDFTSAQLESSTLKSVPFTHFFYLKENLLFPKDSLLPYAKLPSLLWTPIERALPVENATYNHNFFGINIRQPVKLKPCEQEQKVSVMLIDIAVAESYILIAPAIRLQAIQWMLLNQSQAIFWGEPLLPLNGDTYWRRDGFIFPVGYDLEFPILSNIIKNQLDERDTHHVWWINAHHYTILDATLLKPLSIASWKLTLQSLSTL